MIVSEPAIPDGIIPDITDAITATIFYRHLSKHYPRDEDGVGDDD